MYQCKHCKAPSIDYKGKCPNIKCDRWNCLIEVDPSEIIEPDRDPEEEDKTQAVPITQLKGSIDKRFSTGIAEADRVLGTSGGISGLVYPSLILVAGAPGIGKSTILLQIGANVARDVGPVVYATGEESRDALASRATRLGASHDNLYVMETNHLEHVDAAVKKYRPRLLIVDSTQTMARMDVQGSAGSVTQVREMSGYLRPLANTKGHEMAIVIVGHVNKEGDAAGPETLKHLVDAMIYFEGEKNQTLRILRADKNRFNNLQDIGVLQMSARGLVDDVLNPSEHFLAQRCENAAGSVITSTCSGSNSQRAILVEMQALFSMTESSRMQVVASGLDKARVETMCTVLSRKAGVKIDGAILTAQVVGGMEVNERAADLAIAIAIASAATDRPLRPDTAVFGEVDLMGGLRDTSQAHVRLTEAVKMGFKKAIVPTLKNMEPVDGIELLRAHSLAEAVEMALAQ